MTTSNKYLLAVTAIATVLAGSDAWGSVVPEQPMSQKERDMRYRLAALAYKDSFSSFPINWEEAAFTTSIEDLKCMAEENAKFSTSSTKKPLSENELFETESLPRVIIEGYPSETAIERLIAIRNLSTITLGNLMNLLEDEDKVKLICRLVHEKGDNVYLVSNLSDEKTVSMVLRDLEAKKGANFYVSVTEYNFDDLVIFLQNNKNLLGSITLDTGRLLGFGSTIHHQKKGGLQILVDALKDIGKVKLEIPTEETTAIKDLLESLRKAEKEFEIE